MQVPWSVSGRTCLQCMVGHTAQHAQPNKPSAVAAFNSSPAAFQNAQCSHTRSKGLWLTGTCPQLWSGFEAPNDSTKPHARARHLRIQRRPQKEPHRQALWSKRTSLENPAPSKYSKKSHVGSCW